MDKAQCIYCGKIVYIDDITKKVYEKKSSSRENEISRYERCTGHRKSSGELGFHKYTILSSF